MDNFNLKKFLIENKLTTNSRLNESEERLIPVLKETTKILKSKGIPYSLVSFQDLEREIQAGMDVEGQTTKEVIKLKGSKGNVYVSESGYGQVGIDFKNPNAYPKFSAQYDDDWSTGSAKEVVSILERYFL